VEKYGTARQATDDNITRRMGFACWITKATDKHSEYVIFIAFPRQQIVTRKRFNITFTRTLPALSSFKPGDTLGFKGLSLFKIRNNEMQIGDDFRTEFEQNSV
jgi:hypothetical protein